MQKESVETEIKKKKKINYEICLIGTSTGGPPALQKVLRDLPENFPLGIVIVQHMPKTFTASLAERLNSICNIRVKESEDRDCIEPGLAIIGKAGYQIDFYRQNGKVYIRNVEPEETDLFKPSVNKMFMNASKVYNKILGAVMTGMGNDGLESIQQLKNSNMYIIAESKETAVVYGMPGVLAKAGLADKILPLWKISDELIKQA
jgi:two-component system chemotaxis response regulator CheB